MNSPATVTLVRLRRLFLSLIATLGLASPVSAQIATWEWGLQSTNPTPTDGTAAGGSAVAADGNGAVYVSGGLSSASPPQATRSFGSAGVLQRPGGFIAKAATTGSWAWSVEVLPMGTSIIGDKDAQVTALAVTAAGDVYAAGTVAADSLQIGGIKQDLTTSYGQWVARLSSAGVCQWLRTIEPGSNAPALALDPSTGGVVVAGTYVGSPTLGATTLPPLYAGQGRAALFVARLSANGQWTAAVGSTGSTGLSTDFYTTLRLAVGRSGQVAVGGRQGAGNMGFGTLSTTVSSSSNAGFVVAQLSPGNQWQWATASSTGLESRIYDLAYTPNGALWVAGGGTIGTVVGPLTISSPATSIPPTYSYSFIGQLSAAGQWLLAQQPPLSSTYLSSLIALRSDNNGNAVVVGGLGSLSNGPVQATIGGQSVAIPGTGNQTFAAALSPGGQWRYIATVPRSNVNSGLSPSYLALDGTSIYLTGTVQGAVTFGNSQLLGSDNGSPTAFRGTDMFLAKLSNATALSGRAKAPVARLMCFPNPARYQAIVGSLAVEDVTLLDALGRPARTYTRRAHTTTATLDLTGLPAGLYVVRCGTASGKLVVE